MLSLQSLHLRLGDAIHWCWWHETAAHLPLYALCHTIDRRLHRHARTGLVCSGSSSGGGGQLVGNIGTVDTIDSIVSSGVVGCRSSLWYTWSTSHLRGLTLSSGLHCSLRMKVSMRYADNQGT